MLPVCLPGCCCCGSESRVQTLGYVSLKYIYYRVPFGMHSWGVVFPAAAFAACVTVYHNSDLQRNALNVLNGGSFIGTRTPTATHFTAYLAWFVIGFTSLVTFWLFVRTLIAIAKMVSTR